MVFHHMEDRLQGRACVGLNGPVESRPSARKRWVNVGRARDAATSWFVTRAPREQFPQFPVVFASPVVSSGA